MTCQRRHWTVGLSALIAAGLFFSSPQGASAQGFRQGLENTIDDVVGLIDQGVQMNMPMKDLRQLNEVVMDLLRTLEDTRHGKHGGFMNRGLEDMGNHFGWHHHHGGFSGGLKDGGSFFGGKNDRHGTNGSSNKSGWTTAQNAIGARAGKVGGKFNSGLTQSGFRNFKAGGINVIVNGSNDTINITQNLVGSRAGSSTTKSSSNGGMLQMPNFNLAKTGQHTGVTGQAKGGQHTGLTTGTQLASAKSGLTSNGTGKNLGTLSGGSGSVVASTGGNTKGLAKAGNVNQLTTLAGNFGKSTQHMGSSFGQQFQKFGPHLGNNFTNLGSSHAHQFLSSRAGTGSATIKGKKR